MFLGLRNKDWTRLNFKHLIIDLIIIWDLHCLLILKMHLILFYFPIMGLGPEITDIIYKAGNFLEAVLKTLHSKTCLLRWEGGKTLVSKGDKKRGI